MSIEMEMETETRIGTELATRIGAIDWAAVEAELDAFGAATLPGLLTPRDCAGLAALFEDDARFRSRIDMARHGFGRGLYKYFAYDLPPAVEALRRQIYPHAARTADRWAEMRTSETRFPPDLDGYLARCRAAGQSRPTPLLLRYGPGDFNRLHQDVYGGEVFPLQLVVLLSPETAFEGGSFILAEQRPRMQTRVETPRMGQGDGILFAVAERPCVGKNGVYRAKMRHGVSRVVSGARMTLGVIFHDAA